MEGCRERDPKGLYEKAERGEKDSFTGISSPYEIPENYDSMLDIWHESIEQTTARLFRYANSVLKLDQSNLHGRGCNEK